jgi:hypothetical protein
VKETSVRLSHSARLTGVGEEVVMMPGGRCKAVIGSVLSDSHQLCLQDYMLHVALIKHLPQCKTAVASGTA